MARRQLARKERETAERNLRAVETPKPTPRPRRWKTGRIRKPSYQGSPELLKYEEEVVMRVMRDCGRASVRYLLWRYPDRFTERELWLTLVRLTFQERLESGRGLGWLRWWGYTPNRKGTRWWKVPANYYREFWTEEHARRQQDDS